MITLPVSDIGVGYYVFPPKCNGAHRVLGSHTDDSRTPCVDMVHLALNGGVWSVRPASDLTVAFSGVHLCTIDHDAPQEV